VSSSKRGENYGAEKIGGRSVKKTGRKRGTVDKREMPEGSGSPSRGGSRRHCGTITAQKLDEDFSATLISSF